MEELLKKLIKAQAMLDKTRHEMPFDAIRIVIDQIKEMNEVLMVLVPNVPLPKGKPIPTTNGMPN
jgi:hypothetical protein